MKRIGKEIVGIAILLVSGVAIFFASCEKEDLGGAKGGIAVHFTLGNTSYGAEEVVTRGAGRKLASETVVVPVEGDLCMYATLAEDEELRADIVAIAENTLVRIVAYDADGDAVGNAEYKVTANGTDIEPVGTGLSVPSAGTYTFVAYSLNNTFMVSPYSATVGPYAPGNYDLLWGSAEDEIIGVSNNNVSILMKHKFSKVKVKATTVGLSATPPTIEYIEAYVRSYMANMTVQSGQLTKAFELMYSLVPWTSFTPSTTVTGDERRVYTGDDNSVFAGIYSITIGGTTWGTPSAYIRPLMETMFHMQLEPGKSYTLTLDWRQLSFAGSNIYWDGSMLTFDEEGVTTNQMYQGVFFKWGSLVGISPAGQSSDAFSSSTKVYVPRFTPDDNSDPEWEDPDVFSYSDWTDIPYIDDVDAVYGVYATYLDARNEGYSTDYWEEGKGDICRFLSANGYGPAGNYRMPTAREQGAKEEYSIGSDDWTAVGSPSFLNVSASYSGGTYPISFGISHSGIIFPASGYRDSDGTLYAPGEQGYYWSGSGEPSLGYNMRFFGNGFIYIVRGFAPDGASPIRCVKN
jgi:hypothetical protein